MARINRGGTIFIGDLFGTGKCFSRRATSIVIRRLGHLLAKTGSDFKHLAKATYYVTDDDISKAHNAIRPNTSTPTGRRPHRRPSSAARADPACGYNMDMIAVPSAH